MAFYRKFEESMNTKSCSRPIAYPKSVSHIPVDAYLSANKVLRRYHSVENYLECLMSLEHNLFPEHYLMHHKENRFLAY